MAAVSSSTALVLAPESRANGTGALEHSYVGELMEAVLATGTVYGELVREMSDEVWKTLTGGLRQSSTLC